jgi:hypothetical protein
MMMMMMMMMMMSTLWCGRLWLRPDSYVVLVRPVIRRVKPRKTSGRVRGDRPLRERVEEGVELSGEARS